MQKEKRNKITTLTSPLAGEDARRAGEGERGNTLLNPLIGFECVRTQNHFPRQGGSHTTNAFTLIELLVVVLIIGILAAVALPQYQKAVEKSKAAQAQTMLKTVYNAAKAYQLANGSWPTSFDELAVDIPWTGNTLVTTQSYHRTKSNEDWSLVLAHSDRMNGIWVIRNSGKYANAGFVIPNKDDVPAAGSVVPADQMMCVEGSTSGGFLQNFLNQTGDYCGKIMKGKEIINTNANRHFIL